MTISYAQLFCSVADLIADMQSPGGDEALLYQKCRDASDYLQKEIGHFIPVTDTVHLDGNGESELVTPPILAIMSLTNYGTALVEGTDYLLRPERRKWPFGPATWLVTLPLSSLVRVWGANMGNSIYDRAAVVVNARFGLFERSVDSGATIQDAPQSNSQTTLKVNNGAGVSPGMVLKVESEQQLVTGWAAPTDSATMNNGAIAVTDEVITLADGTKVNIGEIIRIELEQMKVRDISTNQILVRRGWNKTPAVTHATGKTVYAYRVANVDRGVNGTASAQHNQNVAIARYVVPDDISFLAKEIATLMLNKSLSGYQGRTGNDQGVIFYNDAFPRDDIKRLKEKYLIGEA